MKKCSQEFKNIIQFEGEKIDRYLERNQTWILAVDELNSFLKNAFKGDDEFKINLKKEKGSFGQVEQVVFSVKRVLGDVEFLKFFSRHEFDASSKDGDDIHHASISVCGKCVPFGSFKQHLVATDDEVKTSFYGACNFFVTELMKIKPEAVYELHQKLKKSPKKKDSSFVNGVLSLSS